MKKIAFALIVVLLFGIKTIKAQEQELSASEPISSGCLSHSRGAEIATSPTIKLTKEENILSVELLNYTSNCGTTGFEVENKIIDGNNENPTVAINVTPVIPAYMDCTCPFNISYTVRDLEKNKFYLTCWWYEGQVELTEGEPLVLEYQTKDVVIDGLKFRLLKVSHQAILISQNTWDNNVTTLQIPSEVEYEGEKYTVTSVNQNVSFSKNSSITKIIIPKTVKNTDFGSNEGFKYNPFVDCFSVESIEVEEGNPTICSVDGVLFNKDTTTLIGYPAASARESYTVPASVKTAGDGAFFNSKYLKKIVLPDNIETLGYSLFASSKSLEEVVLPSSIKELSIYLFKDCTKLKSVVIPEGVTTIGYSAFEGCSRLESISLPESINFIDFFAFGSLSNLKNVYCQAKIVPNTSQNVFGNVNLSKVTLHVPAASISAYQATEPWKNFKEIVALPAQNDMAYRPFIEEGKVWKVGTISGNPVLVVDYYYFDGDTIIGGRTCKQMMRQRYVSPDYPEYDNLAQLPTLSKVGAWYEKDKKVYFYNENKQSFMIKYDFSIGANESLQLIDDYPSFIIGPRQTGEIDGFKGVYRDVMINQNVKSTTWLEGVGGIEGPTRNAYAEATDHMQEFLMSCTAGDEVIYLNEKYEDGATPGGARKDRFDFTHTVKTKPKAPRRSEDAQSLYGEYNNLQLGINLNPLDDTYQVSITNESGKVVYEKAINAGNIVGLNIDISAYAKGHYTVTVENSQESFTGEFETQTTGIEENVIIRKLKNVSIYNLQGQRINYLQKGLNIVNGRKVYVK
jgi:hypothetical protein